MGPGVGFKLPFGGNGAPPVSPPAPFSEGQPAFVGCEEPRSLLTPRRKKPIMFQRGRCLERCNF